MILECTCEQAHQDEIYGKGKRLHRYEDNAWVCNVCGTKRTIPAPVSDKPKSLETKPSPSTKKK